MVENRKYDAGGYYAGEYITTDGEFVILRDFYVPHDPVYVPGFEPGSEPKSMTRQEFAAECDINNIMKQYDGQWPPLPPFDESQYQDLTDMPSDLMGAMEYHKRAEEAFMRLPAAVRREFENSPISFVDFAVDPKNIEQMRAWGLAPPKESPPVSGGAAPSGSGGGDASGAPK